MDGSTPTSSISGSSDADRERAEQLGGQPLKEYNAFSAAKEVPEVLQNLWRDKYSTGEHGRPQHEQPQYQFQRQGANFAVAFEGEQGTIPTDLQGAWYIYWLLQAPNIPQKASSLRQRYLIQNRSAAGLVSQGAVSQHEAPAADETGELAGASGDAADEIEYLQSHACDLHKQITEAKASKDQRTVDRLWKELDQVLSRVKSLKGMDGKPRRDDPSEKDRVSVSNAINTVIKNCHEKYALPRMGRYLDDKISPGVTCSYQPGENAPSWQF